MTPRGTLSESTRKTNDTHEITAMCVYVCRCENRAERQKRVFVLIFQKKIDASGQREEKAELKYSLS